MTSDETFEAQHGSPCAYYIALVSKSKTENRKTRLLFSFTNTIPNAIMLMRKNPRGVPMKRIRLVFAAMLVFLALSDALAEDARSALDAFDPVLNMIIAGLSGDEAIQESGEFNISMLQCALTAGTDPMNSYVARCPGCGATTKIYNTGDVCRYCGNPLIAKE